MLPDVFADLIGGLSFWVQSRGEGEVDLISVRK
jgi:hypothetical protein